MLKRLKILVALIFISVCLCVMSGTYSRYMADTSGKVDLSLAKWQILVNTNDITTGATSNIDITPIIEEDPNVKSGTIAPTSKGYYDINIDPTNVDVSYSYHINLELDNERIPDLLITKYAILENDFDPVEDEITYHNYINNDGEITETFLYDQEKAYEPFTVRVYFEWIDNAYRYYSSTSYTDSDFEAYSDSVYEPMGTDEDDTIIGYSASVYTEGYKEEQAELGNEVNNDSIFTINARIRFEQVIN